MFTRRRTVLIPRSRRVLVRWLLFPRVRIPAWVRLIALKRVFPLFRVRVLPILLRLALRRLLLRTLLRIRLLVTKWLPFMVRLARLTLVFLIGRRVLRRVPLAWRVVLVRVRCLRRRRRLSRVRLVLLGLSPFRFRPWVPRVRRRLIWRFGSRA